MDEEQAHHQLEDEGLPDRVTGQTLHHLAICRQHFGAEVVRVERNLLTLDDEQE